MKTKIKHLKDLKKSNQEPKSIKKSDQEPKSRKRADQEPKSRKRADQEPKSRKRADQEPKSRKRADHQGKGYVDVPILLSKMCTNNSSKELINNIKQLINNLYDNKQIIKQVYNILNKAITYEQSTNVFNIYKNDSKRSN